MSSIYSLKDVRLLIEKEGILRRDIIKNFSELDLKMDEAFNIREFYPIFLYIISYENITDIETILIPSIYRIINSQITRKKEINILYGKYSPYLKYQYINGDIEYIKENIGAFPSWFSRSRLYINGLYPDIDSTAISIIILSKTLKKYSELIKRDIITSINAAVEYLIKRDINRDGLVEQEANEDWAIGAHREGIVAYSNIMYILALEEAYDLYLSIGDKEYIDLIEKNLSKALDSITNRLWMNNYIVNGVDNYGKYDLTYAIDTSLIALTHTLSKDRKIHKHLGTIYRELLIENVLASFSPTNFNEHVAGYPEYTNINGGVWIKFNILFSYGLAKIGYIKESAKLLRNILTYRKHRWINPINKKIFKEGDILENSCLIMTTLKEIKKKLEEGTK